MKKFIGFLIMISLGMWLLSEFFLLLLDILAVIWPLLLIIAALIVTGWILVTVAKARKKKNIQEIIKVHDQLEGIRLTNLASTDLTRVASIDESAYLNCSGVEAELLNIDLMDGHDFEHWCASLLRKIGFQEVEVTQASGDDGVDILAEKDDVRYAIQCKRYSSDLGNKPIQEVHTGKAVYNCHVGAVMTNQHFTEGGRRAAMATGTLLWDRDWLRSKIEKHQLLQEAHDFALLNHNYTDELFPAAVDAILAEQNASPLVLQRVLGIGYSHACSIIDEMERLGLIGPYQGSKPRAILITRHQWNSKVNQ